MRHLNALLNDSQLSNLKKIFDFEVRKAEIFLFLWFEKEEKISF